MGMGGSRYKTKYRKRAGNETWTHPFQLLISDWRFVLT